MCLQKTVLPFKQRSYQVQTSGNRVTKYIGSVSSRLAFKLANNELVGL